MIYIFDLDHTVIDSSHRQLTRPDGSLDLDHWIENCTREKIFADKLLPLARLMRSAYAQGHTVIVCTARVLSAHDRAFLAHHDLKAHAILSRPMGCNTGDADLKRELLFSHFRGQPLARWARNAVFYDDNLGVLEMAKNLGIRTRNAVQLNSNLLKAV
jgi:FMN phosphatase YigB (HAD superfamily)